MKLSFDGVLFVGLAGGLDGKLALRRPGTSVFSGLPDVCILDTGTGPCKCYNFGILLFCVLWMMLVVCLVGIFVSLDIYILPQIF